MLTQEKIKTNYVIFTKLLEKYQCYSPEMMDDIYKDSKEEVFDMVFAGYHGVASGFNEPYTFTPVHIMKPSPLELIEESRNNIVNHIDAFEKYGYSKASLDSYDTLQKGGKLWQKEF